MSKKKKQNKKRESEKKETTWLDRIIAGVISFFTFF